MNKFIQDFLHTRSKVLVHMEDLITARCFKQRTSDIYQLYTITLLLNTKMSRMSTEISSMMDNE